MFTKDYLKLVLADKKKLMPISDVRYVNVPTYDEISVLRLWPIMQQNKEFMMYFPDNLRKGLLPRRDYFFNILNTIDPEYIASVIEHANK